MFVRYCSWCNMYVLVVSYSLPIVTKRKVEQGIPPFSTPSAIFCICSDLLLSVSAASLKCYYPGDEYAELEEIEEEVHLPLPITALQFELLLVSASNWSVIDRSVITLEPLYVCVCVCVCDACVYMCVSICIYLCVRDVCTRRSTLVCVCCVLCSCRCCKM